jgi:hypothetical protein
LKLALTEQDKLVTLTFAVLDLNVMTTGDGGRARSSSS